MKLRNILKLVLLLCILSFNKNSYAQNPENWTKDQLMQPAGLATILETGKDLPVIFSVGPRAYIPNSINIGMTKDKENLDKLKKELKTLPKNNKIVVYCGCCPFDHCPNVRPVIKLLQDNKFTNYFLLNLPTNIKTDWIDKGYPVVKQTYRIQNLLLPAAFRQKRIVRNKNNPVMTTENGIRPFLLAAISGADDVKILKASCTAPNVSNVNKTARAFHLFMN